MSKRDKLCLIGIALLLVIGAPWAFGLFDPERYRAHSDVEHSRTTADTANEGSSRDAANKPAPGFAAMKFRIVDAISKAPLPAQLTIEWFTGSNYQALFKALPCDAKGELFVNSVDADTWHRMRVECDGYVPRSLAPRRSVIDTVTDFGQIELEPLFDVSLLPKKPNGQPFECSTWVKRIWPLPTLEYPLPEPTATMESPGFRFKLTRGTWMAFVSSTYQMSSEFKFEVAPGKLVHEFTVPARPPVGKGGFDIAVFDANGKAESAPSITLKPINFPFKFRGTGFEFPMTDPPYQFRGLPAGRYDLRVSCVRKVPDRDMNRWEFERVIQLEVKDLDSITEVKVVMPRALDVTVHVTAHGKPVSGAHLFLGGTPSLTSGYSNYITDSKGEATIPEVCPGVGRVFQWPWTSLIDDGQGFVAYYPGVRENGWRDADGMKVDVSGDDSLIKEIELYPDDRVALHCKVSIDGLIPDNRLELRDHNGNKLADFGIDENGEFTLLAVPPGKYMLRVRRPYSPTSGSADLSLDAAIELPAAGEQELRLDLHTYGVSGQVTLPAEIKNLDDLGSVTLELRDTVKNSSKSTQLNRKSGAFEFTDVPPGEYEVFLEVTPGDGLGALGVSKRISVVDDDVAGVSLKMPELRRRATITGARITPQFPDAYLEPLFTSIDAEIRLENGQLFGNERTSWSSETPTPFAVRIPCDSECSITLRGSDIVEQRIEHVFNKSMESALSIVVTFQRLTSRAFIELDRGGLRLEDLAFITCSEWPEPDYIQRSRVMMDWGGRVGFMLDPKAPGNHEYTLACKGFKNQRVMVVFESGKVATTKVKLERE